MLQIKSSFIPPFILRRSFWKGWLCDYWSASVCFVCEAAGWSGVDPGGLHQRGRAAAAGLGDLRLPGLLPPLHCLPHTPAHRPGRPHRHQLGLLGKLHNVSQHFSIFSLLLVLQLSGETHTAVLCVWGLIMLSWRRAPWWVKPPLCWELSKINQRLLSVWLPESENSTCRRHDASATTELFIKRDAEETDTAVISLSLHARLLQLVSLQHSFTYMQWLIQIQLTWRYTVRVARSHCTSSIAGEKNAKCRLESFITEQ